MEMIRKNHEEFRVIDNKINDLRLQKKRARGEAETAVPGKRRASLVGRSSSSGGLPLIEPKTGAQPLRGGKATDPVMKRKISYLNFTNKLFERGRVSTANDIVVSGRSRTGKSFENRKLDPKMKTYRGIVINDALDGARRLISDL